jgi:hypothetical protein
MDLNWLVFTRKTHPQGGCLLFYELISTTQAVPPGSKHQKHRIKGQESNSLKNMKEITVNKLKLAGGKMKRKDSIFQCYGEITQRKDGISPCLWEISVQIDLYNIWVPSPYGHKHAGGLERSYLDSRNIGIQKYSINQSTDVGLHLDTEDLSWKYIYIFSQILWLNEFYRNGSRLESISPPKGHLKISGDTFGCHNLVEGGTIT